jgi:Mg/Co/Ni transporter MgtE
LKERLISSIVSNNQKEFEAILSQANPKDFAQFQVDQNSYSLLDTLIRFDRVDLIRFYLSQNFSIKDREKIINLAISHCSFKSLDLLDEKFQILENFKNDQIKKLLKKHSLKKCGLSLSEFKNSRIVELFNKELALKKETINSLRPKAPNLYREKKIVSKLVLKTDDLFESRRKETDIQASSLAEFAD